MNESLKAFVNSKSNQNTNSSHQCFDCLTEHALIIGVKSTVNSVEVCIMQDSCTNNDDASVSSTHHSPTDVFNVCPTTRINQNCNSKEPDKSMYPIDFISVKNHVIPFNSNSSKMKPPRSPVSSLPKSIKSPPKTMRKVQSAYV